MSKRFYDTTIWRKPWFRQLAPAQKAAWFYILCECDNVGVWISDTEAAEFYIGEKVDWTALRENCNGNIEVLPNGKRHGQPVPWRGVGVDGARSEQQQGASPLGHPADVAVDRNVTAW